MDLAACARAVSATDALLRAAVQLSVSPRDLALAAFAALLSRLTRQETLFIQLQQTQLEFRFAPETPFSTLLAALQEDDLPAASAQCQISLPPIEPEKILIRRPLRGSGDADSIRFLFQPEPGELEIAKTNGLLFGVTENGRHLELISRPGLWPQGTLVQWLNYLTTLLRLRPGALP